MRIYTKDEAESVTKYYSEILIGNVWHVHIDEVIPKLDVLLLEEFLSNLD